MAHYWRDHMYASFMVDPLGLELIDRIGVDRVMWSSDYPHNESTFGYSEQSLASVVDAVGPEDAVKIVSTNVKRFLGLRCDDDDRRRDPEDAERWVLYEKDPATKIATITLNRPEQLNAPTIAMRLRYADLLHQANIDDDVKVLVIRGEGDDFGTGQDLPEFMEAVNSDDGLLREVGLEDADVVVPAASATSATAPPRRSRGSPIPAAAAAPSRSSRRSRSSR